MTNSFGINIINAWMTDEKDFGTELKISTMELKKIPGWKIEKCLPYHSILCPGSKN